tara:strand:+ start:43 stop:528 length:486 start_codon:yes stop_codon:yes gene_type:complete
MTNRKSMRGVEIDLGKLMARQEKNITVGNTKTNARGDQLGKGGRIVKSADELAREHYNRNDPKAVVQGGIKADADTPEIRQTRVEEISKPMEDDWKEPEVTTANEPTPSNAKVSETIGDEDPWVEDKDGNFVRQSELKQEQDEPVSKPKAKQQATPTKKKK